MNSRASKLQISVWVFTGLAILAMCAAAMLEHRVAFGFFAAFALVGVFSRVDPRQERSLPLWVRLSLIALYLTSLAVLAVAEFALLPPSLVLLARCGFVSALSALLAVQIVGGHSSANEASDT